MSPKAAKARPSGMAVGEMPWSSLPLETRMMILEILVQDTCGVALYATVCQEWQKIIEQKNFSRLKLTPSRLANFNNMTHRNRSVIKYIWFCIELQEYDCSQCEEAETDAWWESNTEIIKEAFRRLFSILSTWEPSANLILDISIHSPSDSDHFFKYLDFGSDIIPDPDNKQDLVNINDPRHGWLNGHQTSLPSEMSILRLFGDIEIASDFWQELPEVTAVTGLLLRRQTRRRWEPRTVEELLKRLPRLQEIYYEPWRESSGIEQRLTDESKLSGSFLDTLGLTINT